VKVCIQSSCISYKVVAHILLTVEPLFLNLNADGLDTFIFNGTANVFKHISLGFCAVCKAYFGNFHVQKAESNIVPSFLGRLYPRAGGQFVVSLLGVNKGRAGASSRHITRDLIDYVVKDADLVEQLRFRGSQKTLLRYYLR
jgi:hypothetical protein